MKKHLLFLLVLFVSIALFSGCSKKNLILPDRINESLKKTNTDLIPATTVVTYLTGNAADVTTNATGGLILMGGGTDVDAAIRWVLQKAAGGDVVVIRATGSNGYNKYMYNMVAVNSVETIIIDSRDKANLASVTQKIRNAEALFIAGGNQWDYVNYWKNSATEDAINYLINTKKVTVGGTSAGLAIMGSAYYSAQTGVSVTSAQTLSNPYNVNVTLGQNDFIASTFMQNTITDSHYSQCDRQGRHITFLARMMKDFNYAGIKGIGIDEQTAVCIDQAGAGKVYGINQAYFLQNENLGAETCVSLSALTWNRNALAVKAYKITGSVTGNGSFDVNNWALGGGTSFHYYVNNGVLFQN